jgi:hypothetical protein
VGSEDIAPDSTPDVAETVHALPDRVDSGEPPGPGLFRVLC